MVSESFDFYTDLSHDCKEEICIRCSCIEACTIAGIAKGYSDGTFRPDDYVTVGEVLSMFTLAHFRLYEEYEISDGEHWAHQYAYFLIGNRLILERDYPDERLDEIITRNEMAYLATILNLSLNASTKTTNVSYEYVSKLKDCKDLSENDLRRIDYCLEWKYMDAFEDNTFRPYDNVTRAEACKIIIFATDY